MSKKFNQRKCTSCGKMSTECIKYEKISSGKYYCPECYELKTRECPECHKRYHESKINIRRIIDKNETVHERELCITCVKEKYETCYVCSFLFKKTDGGIVVKNNRNESKHVCENHKKNFIKCSECGEYFGTNNSRRVIVKDNKYVHYCTEHFNMRKNTNIIRKCDICGEPAIAEYGKIVESIYPDGQKERMFACASHSGGLRTADCGHYGMGYSFVKIDSTHRSLLINVTDNTTEGEKDIDGIELAPESIFNAFSSSPSQLAARTRSALDVVCYDSNGPQLVNIPPAGTPQPQPVKIFTEYLLQKKLKEGSTICHVCDYGYQRENISSRDRNRRQSFIHPSHVYGPQELIFYAAGEKRQKRDEDLYLGIELEVDSSNDKMMPVDAAAREVFKTVGSRHVFIKHDGSLKQGFEQVTHPATLKYLLKERERYDNLLKVPKKFGFKSHDVGTCGLHIHVDRAFYKNDKIKMAQLGVLTERFWPELFIFSRRKGNDVLHYAKRTFSQGEQISLLDKGIDVFLEKWINYIESPDERYRTLNMSRDGTMEYRIFRGTLNPITFWATLELVDNMVKLNKTLNKTDILAVKWIDIINYCHYPELAEYNSKTIGDGWNGKTKIEVIQIADETAGIVSIEIPTSLEKEKVRVIKYVSIKRGGEISEYIMKNHGKALQDAELLFLIDNEIDESDKNELTNKINGKSIKIKEDGTIENYQEIEQNDRIFIDEKVFTGSLLPEHIKSVFTNMKVRNGVILN